MVGPQDRGVPGEVVKVVHDDSYEKVEDEEAADHEEADEVEVGHVRSTAQALQIYTGQQASVTCVSRVSGESKNRKKM